MPQVSYLEIYNEQMYDLLSENPGSSEALAVMEDSVTGTYVSLTHIDRLMGDWEGRELENTCAGTQCWPVSWH